MKGSYSTVLSVDPDLQTLEQLLKWSDIYSPLPPNPKPLTSELRDALQSRTPRLSALTRKVQGSGLGFDQRMEIIDVKEKTTLVQD